MSRDFPDWIDIDRAADGRRSFAGELRLVELGRLVEVLNAPDPDAVVDFEVDVWRDGQGTVRVDVAARGALPLTCQRSLARYLEPIETRSSIAAVRDESDIARLPEDLEAKVVENGRLSIAELVEDELLLAIPLVPRDPTLVPIENELLAGEPPDEQQEQAGPFAVLAGLKRGDGD